MLVLDDTPQRIAEISYLRAGPNGAERAMLPVQRLRVAAVPDGCDAVLAASDLQGVATSPWGGASQLLAITLADYLPIWAEEGLIPPVDRLGVLLCGDLYSAPGADRRGVSGDVVDAWLAFALAGCPWIVGIAGNHDVVSAEDLAEEVPSAVLLDGATVERGGTRIGGIGGIIGDPGQPHRRSPDVFMKTLDAVAGTDPSILLLHEGPGGDLPGQLGNGEIRSFIERRRIPLTLCGHVGWEDRPVSRLGAGHVVNTDGRAVILTPA
ncbi:metallophosphoesterase family protein [Actinoallomurus rhizosphaericola]|uniref:metallophosphoesterase family protein n=1 Tax=Actinoallomurus rhizosphaericola TaxID=2952536 RepID=UPI002093D569|nr:metallophosphoesterase [Actinoallomurus rhizosphaericola]MCO5996116.1 metallophosphoesterase [Actinoallomurus rhizosphaericola]